MHGGAKGSGAPKGNRNAEKHGFYSAVAKEEWRRLRAFITEREAFLTEIEWGAPDVFANKR
jgi:uncharacterized protein YjcR